MSPMIEEAGFGICVMGKEGTSSEAMKKADVVFMNILDALDFLLKPLRQKATLVNKESRRLSQGVRVKLAVIILKLLIFLELTNFESRSSLRRICFLTILFDSAVLCFSFWWD